MRRVQKTVFFAVQRGHYLAGYELGEERKNARRESVREIERERGMEDGGGGWGVGMGVESMTSDGNTHMCMRVAATCAWPRRHRCRILPTMTSKPIRNGSAWCDGAHEERRMHSTIVHCAFNLNGNIYLFIVLPINLRVLRNYPSFIRYA